MITLQQILDSQSLILKDKKVRLVRHKDNRQEYRHAMKDREALLEYQRNQGDDFFKGCDYIISFAGTSYKQSIFLGVFKILGVEPRDGRYYYDLQPVPEFEDLVDRLVIDWGGSARAWNQWYDRQPKEVTEIRPKGYIGNFPGLLEFVLDYNELRQLVSNPDSNIEWRHHLSSVNGVYLILDNSTGAQYVGSAYGQNGIWQRWCNYAQDATGGNRELKSLIEKDSNHHRHFKFSVLQTLPSNLTPNEIIAVEKLYKDKLGSRMHGMNLN
jgi:hypothetical protein